MPAPVHAALEGAEGEPVEPDAIEITYFRNEPEDGITARMARAAPGSEHHFEHAYLPTTQAHPPTDDGAPARVAWRVRARGTYRGEPYSRSASGWLLVHTPGTRAEASRAQVGHRNEGIVLRVLVRVERAGTYFAYAELWGGSEGEIPIAFGRTRQAWDAPGERVLEIVFGGAVVRARGVDGPFTVRNLRLMQVDSIPPHEQPPIEVVATTPAWTAHEMR